VDSSCIREIRYDAKSRRLDLIYSSGEPYEYFDVPRSKFRALMEAESKGKFVNKEIKPKHPVKKYSR
jgi:lysyl-tRNA synthetase class 2